MFEAIENLLNHPEEFENVQESYRQALEAIDEYLSSESQDKSALKLKVLLLLRVRRFTMAKQVAKRLLMLGGEESEFLDLYGQSLLSAGDFEGAESTYSRAYKLDPDSSFQFGKKFRTAKEMNKLKSEGNGFVSKQKSTEAIASYTTGVEKCKEKGLDCVYVFLNNRSACYMNTKRYNQALADIDESIQANPYLPKPYLRRITCIKQMNLVERMNTVATDYLNALFAMGYKDSAVKSTSREYVNFLRTNNAFKSNVNVVSSKRDVDRVININPDSLIVLDMFAQWCGPCKKLAPVLDELSVTHPSVIFLKIDADKERAIATQYNLNSFPTIVFLKGGKEIDRVVGYDPDRIENLVNEHLALEPDTLFC